MGNRKNIKRIIKYKLFLKKIYSSEKYIVNFFAIAMFVFIFVLYKSFLSFDVYFYDVTDIQKLDIEKSALDSIYDDALNKNMEFEKLLAVYAKENNYFANNSYIEDYKYCIKNKFVSNLMFGFFSLEKENREVYNMFKNINQEIENLPVNNDNYKNMVIVNSFDPKKSEYGTLFIENFENNEDIEVVSATDGVVAKVGYNGDDGLSVLIKTQNENEYTYANLDESSLEVGDLVNAGDSVGYMGNSKQIKDGIVYERRKLTFYINYEREFFGEGSFVNAYPFLYINNIEN